MTPLTSRIFVCLGLLAAFGYPLVRFFAWQLERPEYQAFPFVIASIVAIVYLRVRPQIRSGFSPVVVRQPARSSTVRNGLLLVAAASTCLAAYAGSPWLSMLTLILLLGAIVLHLKAIGLTQMAGPWCLLFLLLPLPLNLDKELTTKLQLLSSWLSSQVLEAVGVLHLLRGNNLHIASKELFVDEACSGIVSLITIISAIAIYCVWLRRSLVHTLAMILLGIGWTVLMNTLRIVTIAVALDWYQVDWSEGTSHTVLAVVLFVVSLGVLKLLDGFLNEFFQPIDTEDHPMGEEQWRRSGWLIQMWDRWFANDRVEADDSMRESEHLVMIGRNSGSATPLADKESKPILRMEPQGHNSGSSTLLAVTDLSSPADGTAGLQGSTATPLAVNTENSLASGYRQESNDSQTPTVGREAEPLGSAFQAEPGTSTQPSTEDQEPSTSHRDELNLSPSPRLRGEGLGDGHT